MDGTDPVLHLGYLFRDFIRKRVVIVRHRETDALSKAILSDYLWMEIIQTVASPLGQGHCWLWLTKNPKEMAKFSAELEKRGIPWPANLWAGTSITKYEKGREHDRLSHLLNVGNDETVRFVSVEPQFGPAAIPKRLLEKLDWIIEGGASARRRADAHPFELKWARDLQRRCKAAGVPFFLKQLGSNVLVDDERLQDSHGGNWDEWPEDLRVRQMPIYRGSKTMRGVRQRKVK